ncbi:MAG: glycosyltransferase [Kiritimatiellae bacterium]|nr:glycosyltransferase [Kiritimatiellia bacterium]
MPERRIDQVLAGFADGDAISHEALLLQAVLRGQGLRSEIYVVPDRIGPTMHERCRPLNEYGAGPDDVLVYHYAIACEADALFLGAQARKVVRYHNITPAEYFDGFSDAIARNLRAGRAALGPICEAAQAVWAVSEFNAAELRALGLKPVAVLPLLFSPEQFSRNPDPGVTAKFGGPLRNILFVGRMVPNKRVEDLILAFAWYNAAVNPHSRLVLVGSDRSCPAYFAMLRLWAAVLDMPNVCFEGFASPEGLAAYYRMADAFVCASDHEGYGLPLLEAMHHGVPVLAKAIGGVPESMAGAGVLFDGCAPRELAELIDRVFTDETLRAEILASQRARMQAVYERDAGAEVKALLDALAAGG